MASRKHHKLHTNLDLEMAGVETYDLGDLKLQSGQIIPNARVAYKIFGNAESPAIIYPTWFSGCKNVYNNQMFSN